MNPNTGQVWVADTYSRRVVRLDSNGAQLSVTPLSTSPLTIEVNPSNGEGWVAYFDSIITSITRLNSSGSVMSDAYGFTGAQSIAVDESSNDVWVANTGNSQVVRLNSAGSEEWRSALSARSPKSISANPLDGSAWVADESMQSIIQLGSDGRVLNRVEARTYLTYSTLAVAVDGGDGSVWYNDFSMSVGKHYLKHIAADSTPLLSIEASPTNTLTVNPATGDCWQTAGNWFFGYNKQGVGLAGRPVGIPVKSISVNSTDGTVWVAAYDATNGGHVIHYPADGNGGALWNGAGFTEPSCVSVYPAEGSVWVAQPSTNEVIHLAANGSELWRGNSFSRPEFLAVNPSDGSVWVVGTNAKTLYHLAASGALLSSVSMTLPGNISGLSVDAADGSAWVSSDQEIAHYMANLSPVANDGTLTTYQALAANGLLTGIDPEGDPLSFSIVADGLNGHASITNNATGAYSYSPNANYNGADSFTFRIFDGLNYSNQGTVIVSILANDRPVAVDDSAQTVEDAAVNISILANDSDPDGDAFSLVSVAVPAHGQSVLEPDNTVTYTPNTGYSGADAFTYTIADEHGTSAEATVTIAVAAIIDPPLAGDDSALTYEDAAFFIPVLNNDRPGDNGAITLSAVTQPAQGSVIIHLGKVYYTPNPNFSGTDSFTYTITDSGGLSDSATVTVTVLEVADSPLRAIEVWRGSGFGGIESVCVNKTDNSCWVADTGQGRIVHVQEDGGLLSQASVYISRMLAVNEHDGSVWSADIGTSRVVHLDANANLLWQGYFNYPQAISLNQADGSVWVADTGAGRVVHLDAAGNTLWSGSGFGYAQGIAVNQADGSVWVSDGSGQRIIHLDANGQQLAVVNGFQQAWGISVNPVDGSVWVADYGAGAVKHIGADGTEQLRADGFYGVISISVNPTDGSVWFGDTTSVVHLSAGGNRILWRGTNFNNPWSVSVNPNDGSCWVADTGHMQVVHIKLRPNQAPVALDATQTTDENTAAAGTLGATDADGDALTFSIITNGALGTATITNATTGAYTYTPNPNAFGADSFTFKTNDGDYDSNVATITLTINSVNDPPVAADDSAGTNEDTPVIVEVLTNDSDPEGATLTISEVGTPAKGQAAANPDGTITYRPNLNYYGADSFTYTITDGNSTATATVNIAIAPVNDPPLAVDDYITLPEDGSGGCAPLLNDSDPEGDSISISTSTPPAHGQRGQDSTWITYLPAPNFNGEDSLTYTVADSHGATATATVHITVTPVKDPPAAGDDSATTAEDTAVTIDVLANDTSIDGRPQIAMLHVVPADDPAHGQITLNPDRTITYTPEANYSGPDSFRYHCYDSSPEESVFATVTINVTPVNDPPVARDDAAITAKNVPVVISPLANDSDIEGDRISITSFTPPAHGQAVANADGSFTYTPQSGFFGGDSFQYTISDGQGATATARVSIQVAEPYIIQVGAVQAGPSETVTLPVTFSGPVPHPELTADCRSNLRTVATAEMMHLTDHEDNFPAATTAAELQASLMEYVGDASVFFCPETGRPYQPNPELAGKTMRDVPDPSAVKMVWDEVAHADGTKCVAYVDGHVTAEQTSSAVGTIALRLSYNAGRPGVLTLANVRKGPGLPSGWEITSTSGPGPDEVFVQIHAPAGVASPLSPDVAHAVVLEFDFTAAGIDELIPGETFRLLPSEVSLLSPLGSPVQPVAALEGSFTATQFNRPPVATDDSVTTDEDIPITISVLANDSDRDGDTLSVSALTQPGNGQATLNPYGSVTYTPNANYNGTDSFGYTISDGNGASVSASVNITINAVSDAPTALDDTATTNEDCAVEIAVLANDPPDVDGDTVMISAITQPAQGSAEILGATIKYTPSANYNGSDSFTYTITDTQGGTATATVNITVGAVNDAPLALHDSATTNEDTQVNIAVLNNDTDPEGDPLILSAVTDPSHGSATINGDGTVAYRPNTDWSGADSFTYTVSDGAATSTATVNVTVNPVNDPPTPADDTALTYEEALVPVDVLANDTDPEADTLSIMSFGQPANGTVVFVAGKLRYQPNPDFNGTDSFTYTAGDGKGTALATVTVTVIPVDDPEREVFQAWRGGGIQTEGLMDVALNTADDSVWVALTATKQIVHFAANGSELTRVNLPVPGTPMSIGVNHTDGSVWVGMSNAAGTDYLLHFSAAGAELHRIAGIECLDLSVNSTDGSVWVADYAGDRLGHFSSSGDLLLNLTSFGKPLSVSVDPADGSVWIARQQYNDFMHLDAQGRLLMQQASFSSALAVAVNENDGTCWVLGKTPLAPNGILVHLSKAGNWLASNPNFSLASMANLAMNQRDGSVWVIDNYFTRLSHCNTGAVTVLIRTGFGGLRSLAVSKTDNSVWLADNGANRLIHILPTGSDIWRSGDGAVSVAAIAANPNDGSCWYGGYGYNEAVRRYVSGDLCWQGTISGNGLSFAVNPADSTVWIGTQYYIEHRAATGQMLWYSPPNLVSGPLSISVNPTDSSVWIADTYHNQVLHLTSSGDLLSTTNTNITSPLSVSVNKADGSCWAAASGSHLVHIAADGTILLRQTDLSGISSVSVNYVDGSVWIGTSYYVIHRDAKGVEISRSSGVNIVKSVSVNPRDGSVWVADYNNSQIVRLAANGQVIARVSGYLNPTCVSVDTNSDACWVADDGHNQAVRLVLEYNKPPAAGNGKLTTNEDTAAGGVLYAVDPNRQPLVFSIVNNGSLGVAAITNAATGAFSYTPNKDANGTDTFTFIANDGVFDSNVATITVTINPINDPPVANKDTVTTGEDTAITIDVLANDTDIDGDLLTIVTATQPSNGTRVINPDGTITYTPFANWSGTDSFNYTIIDAKGGSSTASVYLTVTAVNDPPVAVDDSFTVVEDAPEQDYIVAANDKDVDDTVLKVVGFTQPAHGTVALSTSSKLAVRYAPDPNWNGKECFTYVVSDGRGGTATGMVTVTVTPVSDPPVATDDVYTMDQWGALQIAAPGVLTNDSDADGDKLSSVVIDQPQGGTFSYQPNGSFSFSSDQAGTFTFTYRASDGQTQSNLATVTITVNAVNRAPVAEDGALTTDEDMPKSSALVAADLNGDSMTYSIVADPTKGTVSLDTATGAFTYTPDPNANGSDSFTFKANDGTLDSNVGTFTINIVAINDSPLAVDDTAVVDEDHSTTILSLSNDSDGDGDSLVIIEVGEAADGQAAANANNTISYTPEANYSGPDSFTYTISDGHGGTATATVNITVNAVNDPPLAADDAAATLEDTPVTINVLSNDSDIDRDALTVTEVGSFTHGTAVINPIGSITYSPALNYFGPDSFTYTIRDGAASATATVSISVAGINDPPIAFDMTVTTDEDTPITVNTSFNDPDGPGRSFALVSSFGAQSVEVFDAATGVFGFNPLANFAGDAWFTFKVNDGLVDSNIATVFVAVKPVNDPPTADAGGAYEITLGEPLPLDGSGSADPEAPADSVVAYEWDTSGENNFGPPSPSPAFSMSWEDLYLSRNGDIQIGVPFTITLRVTDSNGATATASTTVTVLNSPPEADAGGPYETITGQGITLDGAGSSDPDATCGDSIVKYEWDIGGNGAWDKGVAAPGTIVTWSELQGLLGPLVIGQPYPIILQVTDGNGATATAVTAITVVNTAPTAAFTFAPTSPTTATAVNFTDGSSDLEGAIASWSWNFGDGATSTSRNSSHQYSTPGTYTVSLTVTDAQSVTANMSYDVIVSQLGNTQPGSNVSVNLGSGVSLTFSQVTAAGDSSVITSSNPPQSGLKGVRFMSTYYDISTTAGYTGYVYISITYNQADVASENAEKNLKIWHADGSGGWQDVTYSLDTVNNIIVARVTSFSWFAIGWPTYEWLGFQSPITNTGKAFKQGSTIPVKFRIARNGQSVPNAVAELNIYYLVNGAPSGEPEVISTAAGDLGSLFRYSADDDTYIFNLSTKNQSFINRYTYLAEVVLDDGTKYNIQFSLK